MQIVCNLPDSFGADLDGWYIGLRIHPGCSWTRPHVLSRPVRVRCTRLLRNSHECFSCSFNDGLQPIESVFSCICDEDKSVWRSAFESLRYYLNVVFVYAVVG